MLELGIGRHQVHLAVDMLNSMSRIVEQKEFWGHFVQAMFFQLLPNFGL
jgi:hypothetical protein